MKRRRGSLDVRRAEARAAEGREPQVETLRNASWLGTIMLFHSQRMVAFTSRTPIMSPCTHLRPDTRLGLTSEPVEQSLTPILSQRVLSSRRESVVRLALDPCDKWLDFLNRRACKETFMVAFGKSPYHQLDRCHVSRTRCETANILRVKRITSDRFTWPRERLSLTQYRVAPVVIESWRCKVSFVSTYSRVARRAFVPTGHIISLARLQLHKMATIS